MSLQKTIDGLLNVGVQVYTADRQANTEAELARFDERDKARAEFTEQLFEEREARAQAVTMQGQNLIKFGVIGLLAVGGLMLLVRAR